MIAGSSDVGAIAHASGVQRVVLTHASPGITRLGAREMAIAEVAETCDGTLLFPEELTTVDLTSWRTRSLGVARDGSGLSDEYRTGARRAC